MAEKSCLPRQSRLVTKWQMFASLWHLSHIFAWCGRLVERRQWMLHGTIFNSSTLLTLTHSSQFSDSKSTAVSFICRLLNGTPMMRKMWKRLTFANDAAEPGVKLATDFFDTARSDKHFQNMHSTSCGKWSSKKSKLESKEVLNEIQTLIYVSQHWLQWLNTFEKYIWDYFTLLSWVC